MNTENLEALQESLYRKGFGKELNAELEQQMQSGVPEFMLEHHVKIGEEEVGFRLHFRRDDDPQKDKVYFNSYDAAIFKNGEAPGELREHNFPADKLITAMEAYRMLKYGELVAVNKTLFNKEGNQYNTWLSIDITGKKDEYNNYPVNSYHENYFKKEPYELSGALKKLPVPVKELESAKSIEIIEKSLKKANLVHVTIYHNGQEQQAFLSVNPKERRIDLYDTNMQLLENKAVEQQQATPAQEQEDEKKKSAEQDQRVNWSRKEQQGKGMRP